MISQCPHCRTEIRLGGPMKDKLKAALTKLKPGAFLKFGCPHCKKPIELDAKGSPANGQKSKNGNPPSKKTKTDEAAKIPPEKKPADKAAKGGDDMPKPVNPPPDPPKPPDLGWLKSGKMEDREVIEDVPTAMILMPEGSAREVVSKVYQGLDFQIFSPKKASEAIESMRFKNYAAVIYHVNFEGGSLEKSEFHAYMMGMAMNKRRYIFYALVGPDFQTFYDLEALAYSANIVINEKEIKQFKLIQKKAFAEYEDLFKPHITMLKEHGKR